jgi:hypothetical protein
MVFVLIMGTYVPYTWIGFMTVCQPVGWIVFGVVWAGCILGIVMNSINIKKYDKLSMIDLCGDRLRDYRRLLPSYGKRSAGKVAPYLLLRWRDVLDWRGPLSDWRQEIAMVAYRFPFLCSGGYPFHVLLDFLFRHSLMLYQTDLPV